MTTTNTTLELNWGNLFTEAVTKPGKILDAWGFREQWNSKTHLRPKFQCGYLLRAYSAWRMTG